MCRSTHKMWRQLKSGKEAAEGEEGGGGATANAVNDSRMTLVRIFSI